MQCYHRKLAWITDKGLSFKPVVGVEPVSVPCGRCDACKVNNAMEWATRAVHEDVFCSRSCFVTLTYNREHLPKNAELCKSDLQEFLKRLRGALSYNARSVNYKNSVRQAGALRAYFACGEYGTKRGRPHYHLVLFDFCPNDLVFDKISYRGDKLYTSAFLSSLWSDKKGELGKVWVGTLTGGSAAYVARYQKKLSKDNSGARVKPFFLSSRGIPLTNGEKGALGAQWVLDYHSDLLKGYVPRWDNPKVKCRIPSYYFKLVERWFPDEFEHLKQYRYDYAMGQTNDLMIVEDTITHLPTFRVRDRSVNTIQALLDYAQVPFDFHTFEEAFALALATLRRCEDYQQEKINKLKRGYHDE